MTANREEEKLGVKGMEQKEKELMYIDNSEVVAAGGEVCKGTKW